MGIARVSSHLADEEVAMITVAGEESDSAAGGDDCGGRWVPQVPEGAFVAPELEVVGGHIAEGHGCYTTDAEAKGTHDNPNGNRCASLPRTCHGQPYVLSGARRIDMRIAVRVRKSGD